MYRWCRQMNSKDQAFEAMHTAGSLANLFKKYISLPFIEKEKKFFKSDKNLCLLHHLMPKLT